MVDYIAFFAAIPHSEENEKFMVESLLSYDIGNYLIVKEISEKSHKLTNGEHYHFLVQMSNDDYIRYRKRVFLDHFKLKGRATKDCGRQYGKVNYLKDPDRMAVYMFKDIDGTIAEQKGYDDEQHEYHRKIVANTFTQAQLVSWQAQSFKKSEQKGYKDCLKLYVDDHLEIEATDDLAKVFYKLCVLQVEFNRYIASEDCPPSHKCSGMRNAFTKAQLVNFANWYLTYFLEHKYKDKHIVDWIVFNQYS